MGVSRPDPHRVSRSVHRGGRGMESGENLNVSNANMSGNGTVDSHPARLEGLLHRRSGDVRTFGCRS